MKEKLRHIEVSRFSSVVRESNGTYKIRVCNESGFWTVAAPSDAFLHDPALRPAVCVGAWYTCRSCGAPSSALQTRGVFERIVWYEAVGGSAVCREDEVYHLFTPLDLMLLQTCYACHLLLEKKGTCVILDRRNIRERIADGLQSHHAAIPGGHPIECPFETLLRSVPLWIASDRSGFGKETLTAKLNTMPILAQERTALWRGALLGRLHHALRHHNRRIEVFEHLLFE